MKLYTFPQKKFARMLMNHNSVLRRKDCIKNEIEELEKKLESLKSKYSRLMKQAESMGERESQYYQTFKKSEGSNIDKIIFAKETHDIISGNFKIEYSMK